MLYPEALAMASVRAPSHPCSAKAAYAVSRIVSRVFSASCPRPRSPSGSRILLSSASLFHSHEGFFWPSRRQFVEHRLDDVEGGASLSEQDYYAQASQLLLVIEA